MFIPKDTEVLLDSLLEFENQICKIVSFRSE